MGLRCARRGGGNSGARRWAIGLVLVCGTVGSIHIKRASYKQSRKSTICKLNNATPAAGGQVIPWPLVRSFYTASGVSTKTVVYCLEQMMRKVSGTRAHTRKVCLAFAGRTHIRSARVKLHCTAGKDISHLGETTSVFNPAASEIHGGTVDWWQRPLYDTRECLDIEQFLIL